MNEHWMERNGVTLWWGWRAFALQPGWWQAMLAVARQHGWTPSGTRPPLDYWGWKGDPATWDGRYWPGGGQQMTKEDARAFGAALGCALADIPDHDAMPASWAWELAAMERLLAGEFVPALPPDRVPHVPDVHALERLSGRARKETLGWFIKYCRSCRWELDIVDYEYMDSREGHDYE
jgi:hypothetical protein